jgi:hypothetical protein
MMLGRNWGGEVTAWLRRRVGERGQQRAAAWSVGMRISSRGRHGCGGCGVGSLDGTVMDARVMGESGAMGFLVIVMPAENMTVNLESYGKFRAPAGSARQ